MLPFLVPNIFRTCGRTRALRFAAAFQQTARQLSSHGGKKIVKDLSTGARAGRFPRLGKILPIFSRPWNSWL
jgi:hypothetical protein